MKRKLLEFTKSFKRRRLELRAKRKQSDTSTELREGDTYKSGVSLNSNCGTVEIPTPVSVPGFFDIPNDDYLFISFDVETTLLEDDCDLVQLSAVLTASYFDAYVIPQKQTTSSASRVAGLTVVGSQLLLHGKPVSALDIRLGLRNFITWLQSHGTPVVLHGHNVKFDAKVILRSCTEAGLRDTFFSVVVGFCDTLPLLKKLLPGQRSYSQRALVDDIIGTSCEAHNALTDVTTLQAMITKLDHKLMLFYQMNSTTSNIS